MNGAIVAFVEGALNSPWGLLALAAVAAVDGFVPLVLSESLVVTAGVFAAAGHQSVALVIAAAALGAFTGDHVSYVVGRRAGDRLAGGLRPGRGGPPPTRGPTGSWPTAGQPSSSWPDTCRAAAPR